MRRLDPRLGRLGRRGQAGVSLLEVLISTLVVVPMTLTAAMGLSVTVGTSDRADSRLRLVASLSTVTENLKAMPYLPCGTPDEYRKVYSAWVPTVAEQSGDSEDAVDPGVMKVDTWHPEKGDFVEQCERDGGAQRLTVKVTNGTEVLTGTVVKRNGAAGSEAPR